MGIIWSVGLFAIFYKNFHVVFGQFLKRTSFEGLLFPFFRNFKFFFSFCIKNLIIYLVKNAYFYPTMQNWRLFIIFSGKFPSMGWLNLPMLIQLLEYQVFAWRALFPPDITRFSYPIVICIQNSAKRC